MACGGDVRTSVGGVVVGEMMRLVAWCVHGCFGLSNDDHNGEVTLLVR